MRVNNVYQSFADSVKMYRDKVAIIDDKMKLTYEEINVMSNKVAKFLVEKSIGKENVVAVYMDIRYFKSRSCLFTNWYEDSGTKS